MRPEQPDDKREPAAGPDLWQLAGLPGGLLEASYLTGRYAAQYRVIVDVLLEQQQHTLTGVSAAELPDLLRARLGAVGADPELIEEANFDLKERMGSLARWGVIHRFQDKALRDADFIRDLDRYQLTETAAQLHRAVTSFGQDLAAGAAATLAPGVLTANLTVLRDNVTTDPDKAAAAWSIIETTYQAMARAAAGWQSRLAGALAGTPTAEKIGTVQETLRRYVDMWGAGIDTHSEMITTHVNALTGLPDAVWRRIGVHNLGQNADEQAIVELTASYRRTLDTLRAWFDGPDCQARRLRRQMRDTIQPLLRGQRTLAAVGGHVSRRAELLALAGQLEAAPDDAAAWQLWCTATSLYSAVHLPGLAPAPAGNPSASSFWDAEPVLVEARLRKQGPKATTGTASRIADNREHRKAARDHNRRLQQEAERTEQAILARSGLLLSQWTDLSDPELDMLLRLLSTVAASRPDQAGVREVVTGDGRWYVRAEPAESGVPSAVVSVNGGRLVHPDVRLHITATAVNA
ncbi:DUF2397 domain-containing protein [Couchioplanes caeruleus]|uniref:DUF2397 domain-containing protein n=1 Tax=Couchioplanes caeruleus TaxID=56438 RepID=UPI0020BFD33D|nr:DUF2397 domain-containing protein [Couchioplanes caeruleus]UQU62533.1 DUF2397 domain-containing protein [Couchioplanes caeruleus]